MQIGCDRLLHQNVFLCLRTETKRLKAKIGKSANVDVVDSRVSAYFLKRRDELRASILRELPAFLSVGVRANGHFVSDVLIGLLMLARDCSCTDDSDSHLFNPVEKFCLTSSGLNLHFD
jgi:hypothetical protein